MRPDDEALSFPPSSSPWDPITEVQRYGRVYARMFGTHVECPRVGRYELGERIGSGGAGLVHRGVDPVLRRPVAIKLIPIPPSLTDAQRAALMAEAQVLAAMDHPSLVKVHDAGVSTLGEVAESLSVPGVAATQAFVYLVMECVDGPGLERWLSGGKSTREITATYIAIGEALAAAHGCGVVHRDVKPSNIAFDHEGRPKVLDFGLAESDDLASRRASERAVVGTPAYMAPEQHEGRRAGPAADQFAFCVCLWEALAAKRPFAGPTVSDFRNQKARRERAGGGTPIPRAIRRALLRGLEPDPDARWSNMNELLAALRPGNGLRRLATFGAVVVVLTGALWAFAREPEPQDSPAKDPCLNGPAERAARIWSPERKARFDASLERGAALRATEISMMVDERLVGFQQAWATNFSRACALEPVARSAAVACLDEAEATARGFLDALDRKPGVRVLQLLDLLPEPEGCLSREEPMPPEMVDHRRELALFHARLRLGELEPVSDHAEQRLGDATLPQSVRAEWQLLSGLAAAALGRGDAARSALERAWANAEASGNTEVRARALLALCTSLFVADPTQSGLYLDLAESQRALLGTRGQAALDAVWARYELVVRDDPDAAVARWRALTDRSLAADASTAHIAIATAAGLAEALISIGKLAEAEEQLSTLLDDAPLDDRNPFIAALRQRRAGSRWLLGDLDGAHADLNAAAESCLPSEARRLLELYTRVAADRGAPADAEPLLAAWRNEPGTASVDDDPVLIPTAGLARLRGRFSVAESLPPPEQVHGTDWELDLLHAAGAVIAQDVRALDEAMTAVAAKRARLDGNSGRLLTLEAASVLAWAGDAEACATMLRSARDSPSAHLRARAELTLARAALRGGDEPLAASAIADAANHLSAYAVPWPLGLLQLELLRASVFARSGQHARAWHVASAAMALYEVRGSLALMDALSLLAVAMSGEDAARVRAWIRDVGAALGADPDVVAWFERDRKHRRSRSK